MLKAKQAFGCWRFHQPPGFVPLSAKGSAACTIIFSLIFDRFSAERSPHGTTDRIRQAIQGNHSPAPFRAFFGASGPVHLRRPVRGREQQDPQRQRDARRRGGGAASRKAPRASLARRLLRRRISLAGRRRPQGKPQAHGQHQLGRRGGGQHLRHPRIYGAVPSVGLRALHQRQSGQRHRAGNERVGGIPDQQRRLRRGPGALGQRPAGAVGGEILGRGQRKLGLRRQYAAGVLRRRVPPLSDLLPQLWQQPAVPHRLRPQRGRHGLDE